MNFNHFNSIKVYALSSVTYLVNLTSAAEEIKVILLILTAIFTIVKTVDIIKSWKKKERNEPK